ncbi:MAG: StbB family protein [Caldimonas sp.]
MKICVLNFSGNVGKTTVAAHLLQPRMNAQLFSVETLNQDAEADGVDIERLKGDRFGDLQRKLQKLDAAIVDVGSSNVETFLALMGQYEGSQEDFDYFVVPTVSDKKQTADTVNTILALHRLGVEPERIKVVFNKVDITDDVTEEFGALFGLKAQGLVQLNEKAALQENEVFELIKDADLSLAAVIADQRDFRQAVRDAKTPAEQDEAINLLAIKRLSTTCARNLDATYAALFAK